MNPTEQPQVLSTTAYGGTDSNYDYKTCKKDHVDQLPCDHVIKKHGWLQYSATYALNKDPSG